MKKRHGRILSVVFTLPAALAVLLASAVISMYLLDTTYINIRDRSLLAQRRILEQATNSFAQVLFDEVLNQRDKNENGVQDTWLKDENAFWEGTFDFKPDNGEFSPMRFVYAISADINNTYALYLSGEFLPSRDIPAVELRREVK